MENLPELQRALAFCASLPQGGIRLSKSANSICSPQGHGKYIGKVVIIMDIT
jgi:hypothetical protein